MASRESQVVEGNFGKNDNLQPWGFLLDFWQRFALRVIACIWGNAHISGDARIEGDACIWGDARTEGDAGIWGDARIEGDACIWGNRLHDRVTARIMGNARI